MSWWKWKPTTTAVNQYSYKAHATALTVDLMTLTVNPRRELLSWWQAKTQGQCLKIQLVQKRVESGNSRTDTTDCITFAAYAVDINFGDDCCKEYKKSLCSASYVHWQRGTTRIRPLHAVLLCTVYSRQSPWGRSRTGLQVLLLLRCRKRRWNNVLRHNTEAAHIYFLL